eukprot:CAMPEP_0174379972 /NCGR_PEP_ID=MMETSP0811_2-20130205/123061_1 /TAXON_ID=73025 ORGANISM="Eutreptiella gymnastica-like, Strain CCMP1594" /NCGR_SAMPLE_ID=MMETSP0811_2 /ASSEMBLY_ACC=CAM_ASM_000667 /LENGTH=33 /DNA_ID= /DNA_START= /DNA_END= /DNA_ORIENTATION=
MGPPPPWEPKSGGPADPKNSCEMDEGEARGRWG